MCGFFLVGHPFQQHTRLSLLNPIWSVFKQQKRAIGLLLACMFGSLTKDRHFRQDSLLSLYIYIYLPSSQWELDAYACLMGMVSGDSEGDTPRYPFLDQTCSKPT